MNRQQLAQQFARQEKKTGNLFFEGQVCYSYGRHFPIAVLRGSHAFYNSDSYSPSTSRQQSAIRNALVSAGFTITPRDTAELQAMTP